MSASDSLLAALYGVQRDPQVHTLAARAAPLLYFDAREPFLPLAAGYTVFLQDAPSPSFKRMIELRPDEKVPAAAAVEYAIWWDWDIHHLYELEHAWVYLDDLGAPVRVEASWHGRFYEIPLRLEEGRPVLLSEPGKHAFAPHPSWFEIRQRDYRRTDTVAVGLHAGVLVNELFSGKIREQVFDRVLVRSFLARSAFDPAWRFTQRFSFPAETLVPWPVLRDWIPGRVNAVLEGLEAAAGSDDFRALRAVSAPGTADGLEIAARSEADVIHVPVYFEDNRLLLGRGDGALDLDEAFQFLSTEPMGAILEVADERVVDPLAWFVRSREVNGHAIVMSRSIDLLSRYNAFVPGGVTALRLGRPAGDAVEQARASRSAFLNPDWGAEELDPAWVKKIHSAGIGVIGGPAARADSLQAMQRIGVDMVWQSFKPGE